jgi:putative drug exporter of the RND superfamily
MNGVGRFAKIPCGKISKWIVLVLWLGLMVVASGPASKLTKAQDNNAESWLPGNAESTEVLKKSEAFYPTDEILTVLVYARGEGITPADQAAVADQVKKFGELNNVDREIVGPIPSQDGKALQVLVPINAGEDGWEVLGERADQMRDIANSRPAGLDFHITGPGGFGADSSEAFAGIDGKLLYSAAAVVIIILLLTYRSPVLWLLPLISAGVALFSAQAVIYVLATKADLTVNAQSAGILTVLVFGAGTDYALLLVARYREELRRHEDRHEAMAFALHRAGPAILASGSTVIAGMLCLLFASMNSTKGLGPVAAIGIVVALLAMLTLLPALLVICGRWVFWPLRPTFGSADHTETGIWARVGNRIAKRPRTTWVVTSVILGSLALGNFQLDAKGLSNEESFIGTPDSVVGARVLAEHFPAGSGNPLVVVAKADHADAVKAAFEGTEGIAAVQDSPAPKNGLVYFEGTMSAAPDSQAAKDTVDRVRDAVHKVPGAEAQAGGGTAILLDTLRASAHDNKIIIPVVLVVVFLILSLLLRAILAPVLLVTTVVLSFGAALGVSALVFKNVFDFGGADPSLPLFVFVFLVALGIDYNIFLMTRVHEEAKQHGTRRGALIGLAATGGVITSAGLVLAGTFAVLATLPVVAFAEIGFAVAFGVLLDTIIVRSVLVTALNLDVGRRMWWPSALAKTDGGHRDTPKDDTDLDRGEPILVE